MATIITDTGEAFEFLITDVCVDSSGRAKPSVAFKMNVRQVVDRRVSVSGELLEIAEVPIPRPLLDELLAWDAERRLATRPK